VGVTRGVPHTFGFDRSGWEGVRRSERRRRISVASIQAAEHRHWAQGAVGAVSRLGDRAAAAVQPTGALLAQWRWLIAASLLLLVPIEALSRLAASQRSNGLLFGGMFWAYNDPPQYYSAMRQGVGSASWLIYDRFSQEPHGPALLYPLYVALGKLAALVGWSIEETFLDAAMLARIFLLIAVYAATGIVSRDRTTRRVAFVLVSTSSGLAGFLALVQLLTGWTFPLSQRERDNPELNTFLLLFTAPHLMLGMGLLLVAARLYADCWRGPTTGRQLALAATVAALGFTNPLTLVPFMVVALAHGIVMALHRRRLDVAGHSGLVVALVAASPTMIGNFVTFTFDPFWSSTYGRQNVTKMPPLDEIVLALGLLIPLAALGLPSFVRAMTPGRLLVLLWVLLAVVLMHAPTTIQRRFGIGLHPMLALLAAFGAVIVWRAIRRVDWGPWRPARPVLLVGLFQALIGTSVATYMIAATTAIAPSLNMLIPDVPRADRSAYQPTLMAEAAGWLAANASTDDLVLGSVLTGSYLAGAAPSRVYVGHWVATLDYAGKTRDVHWFYDGPLDDERLAFLARQGIRYVVYGPHERRMGGDPGESPGIPLVFSTPGIDIFDAGPLRSVDGLGGVRDHH